MIRIEDLYRATNKGLDIIFHYYPQARGCEGTNKKFKVRPEEKTASACLFLKKGGGADDEVWKVVDFGDDGRAISPLDICKREEGIERTYEAVLRLAALFDVRDELNHAVNKPDVRKRPATAEEKEGERVWKLKPEIPEAHLKVLGPKVTREHAEELNWYEAEYVGWIRNREATLKYSTDNYPIFVRECVVEGPTGTEPQKSFYKIYEPLNPDKGFRFSYAPAGAKPPTYINGLYELRKKVDAYNAAAEKEFFADPANEGMPFKQKKLPEVFICSGERDALCCKSMGYQPIWFNSETYNLTPAEFRRITELAETVYNIPDIDTTGRTRGVKLALEFIDIHTVWLPDSLREFRDNRGKARKDLKDWMELRDRPADFRGLMELAMPARFWTENVNKKTGARTYDIDAECLAYFLSLNGFFTLHDEDKKDVVFIHIEGKIVSPIRARDVKKYLRDWAEAKCLPRPIRNLIRNSPKIQDSALEGLKEVRLDFTSYTPTTQLFYFPNKIIEATPEGLKEHPAGAPELSAYVWEDKVIPHRIKLMEPMFEITRRTDVEGRTLFDIEVKGPVRSNVFGYLINSSRVHWRKELEEVWHDKDATEQEAYARAYKFCIDGPQLSEAEIAEQKQNLVNKIFAVGYMLHRYKSPSRAWAPQAMDNKIGEDGECNGRSGKSFLFWALSKLRRSVTLSGRKPKLMDNPHVFERVTRDTDFVLVDDCDQYFKTASFYDVITGDMTVNPKNYSSFTIPFQDSPKFCFTTNYVPKDFDSSTTARLLYMVFSDYYHQQAEENDYRETRSVRDDFGQDLLTGVYPEDDWVADLNFFLQCCAFYLSICRESIKPLPPMGNIIKRKYKADMGVAFEDWAYSYFAEDGPHLDTYLVRRECYEEFIEAAKVNKNFYTMHRFTKCLKAFAQLCPYIAEYNPKALQNAQGRISRTMDGKTEDMIYLHTVKAAENNAKLEQNEHNDNNPGGQATFVPDEVPAAGGDCPF